MARREAPLPPVEIRRSARRRRTVSGRMEGGTFVVLMPAGLSRTEEERHVQSLLDKQRRRAARTRHSDTDLWDRALRLSRDYVRGAPRPTSVTWVDNQHSRWASCTPASGSIRVSTRVATMPQWVVDGLLVHEVAHLIEANHGPRFQALVRGYPRYAEAMAFLDGVSFATGRGADAGAGGGGAAGPGSAAHAADVDLA